MNHQLVLQFQGNDAATLEKVIELEDRLIEALNRVGGADVDGHESGDGVTNLSLLARNPAGVWEKIESLVEAAASEDLEINAVAYRPIDGDDFTVLWPADYEGEFALS